MILVDTSVWIRFFANRPPYATELERLLDLDEVIGHELIHGELLIGDRGGPGKLSAYERLGQAGTIPHLDVVTFVLDYDLSGRGVGWIDIHLLATAVVDRLQLWTADQRFAAMATKLGVAYEVAGL